MNAYEYALRNFDNPSLFRACHMCKDKKEMLVLDSCLSSKRGYRNAIAQLSDDRNDAKDREYWSKSAQRWCDWYLKDLKELEELQ